MAASELLSGELRRLVLEAAKVAEARGGPPPVQAMEAFRCLGDSGLSGPFPNLDLGFALVFNLCFEHNTPSLWKLLYHAIASRLVSSFHTLALLTARVIVKRNEEPEAYRLYLELLSQYLFYDAKIEPGDYRDRITKDVDGALQLSHTYNTEKIDFPHVMIFFVFSVIMRLVDGILSDWSLKLEFIDEQNMYAGEGSPLVNVYAKENPNIMKHAHHEQLLKANSLMVLEVLEKIMTNKITKTFLHLIHYKMPEKFNELLQRLLLIETHTSTAQNLISARHISVKLSANLQEISSGRCKLSKHHFPGILVDAGPCCPSSWYRSAAGLAASWISFDVYMENAMDCKNLHSVSAVEVLTELIKTLQVVNRVSWQETFQALWISALQLVQRKPAPGDGHIPQNESRLCMLLSIAPLAIVPLIEDETTQCGHNWGKNKYSSRRQELIFSLQVLGQFPGLLLPPPSVVTAANEAASKAATFIYNLRNGNGHLSPINQNGSSVRAVGSMLHLIVEACIARNLVDSSPYFWPGYVVSYASSEDSISGQESPWSSFMDGAPLTDSLKSSLAVTPASSIAELEKLYNIALNGCEEDQSAAGNILCGASLTHSWNIQEHVVHMVVKLLSPPVPLNFPHNSSGSHLTGYMPMLSAMLFGLVTKLDILALYGLVPELAAALIPLCEAFGSVPPPPNFIPGPSDETSIYAVFSCAFLCLLRLWKFYKPPQECSIAGSSGSVKLELTLDYILLIRNRRITENRTENSSTDPFSASSKPVYIDSFPKFQAWHLQNQACIASTLPSLYSKNSVHQVANKVLCMIFRKMKNNGISCNPSMNSSGTSSEEDACERPTLPAWEILEAIPFVLEAVLSACAHGRLSSRDMTTALRDLVDFLPASFATITTYFSAEITRGIWKPVSMNGIDWPSPGANLLLIESEIKEILASLGVEVRSCYASGMAPVLPLPIAALVSLTITFKLEKRLHYIHVIVSQALECCSIACPWSSKPISGAIWTQKASCYHDYIIFSGICSPFARDKHTITQLIGSCFSSFLNLQESHLLTPNCGVHSLLGGSCLPITPGYLYLRTCRSFQDTRFVSDVIFHHVIERTEKLYLKSGKTSLVAAVTEVRDAASLGASLICIAGGLQLVQVLYEETVPEAILSVKEKVHPARRGIISILKGYAMAYLLILCGAFVWGVGDTSAEYTTVYPSRSRKAFVMHVEFMVMVIDGNVALGCDTTTWKAYVSCFIGLLVQLVPAWVPKVRKETLYKLANGLREWNERELALRLLECGEAQVVTAVVESVLMSR